MHTSALFVLHPPPPPLPKSINLLSSWKVRSRGTELRAYDWNEEGVFKRLVAVGPNGSFKLPAAQPAKEATSYQEPRDLFGNFV